MDDRLPPIVYRQIDGSNELIPVIRTPDMTDEEWRSTAKGGHPPQGWMEKVDGMLASGGALNPTPQQVGAAFQDVYNTVTDPEKVAIGAAQMKYDLQNLAHKADSALARVLPGRWSPIAAPQDPFGGGDPVDGSGPAEANPASGVVFASAGPTAAQPSQSDGVGAGFSWQGFVGPEVQVPGAPPSQMGAMQRGAAQQMRGIDMQAANDEARFAQEAQIREGARQRYMQQEQDMAQTRLRIAQEQQTAMQAYQDTINELSKPDAPIDPNRFWNNLSTEGRILAGLSMIVGGFADGYVGRENGALKVIQHAVERDVQLQKEAAASRRRGLETKALGQMNLYEMMRAKGLDEVEAEKAAIAAGLQVTQMQLDELVAQSSSQDARAKAEMLKGQLSTQIAMNTDQMLTRRYQLTLQKAQLEADQRKVRMEIALKAQQASGGGELLRGPQVQNLADLRALWDQAKGMKKEFKQVASRLWDKAFGALPYTDEYEYNSKRHLAVTLIGKALDESVLQKHDLERWEEMIPKAGDTKGEMLWDQIIAEVEKRISEKEFQYARFGYRVPMPGMGLGAGGGTMSPQMAQDLGFEPAE